MMEWNKVKLGDILVRRRDSIKILPNEKYKLVTIRLYHKGVVLRSIVSGFEVKSPMSKIKAGDFILSGIDARNGAFGIVPQELDNAIVTNDFWCLDPDESRLNKDFLLFLTTTNFFDNICKESSDGTTQRIRLQKDKFFNYSIFLPRIEDQVILTEKFRKLEDCNLTLKKELVNQFSLIKQLREAFLSEAMQGKFLNSNSVEDPETGSQLLKRIKAEKEQFIKDKKLRKEKELPPIKQEEIPFEIPENWVWCKLGEIAFIKRGKSPKYTENGVFKMLNQKCIRWFLVDTQYSKSIDGKWYHNLPVEQKTNLNDLLVNSTGDGTIGRCAIVNISSVGFVYDSHILNIRSSVNQKLICYLINSDYGQNYIEKIKGATSTKQTELGVGNLLNLIIPLPPLLIQNQVVAKLDQLMKTCDDLETSIKQSQAQNDQLLQQVLKEALEVKNEKVEIFDRGTKIVDLKSSILTLDKLAEEPFEKYVANPVNNIQDIDWEMALMIACMKNKLGVTYGDVGLQKNVYNTNNLYPIFSKQYTFVNSNFGTYSYDLKDDLKENPYLISQKVANNREVYVVNPKYSKQILDKLLAPENKEFVQAINRMLNIYEQPFINKETEKIELYNTVLKVAQDKKTRDIEIIYQGMKDWKINQVKYKTKAEKFSKSDSKRMLDLLISSKVLITNIIK